MRTATEPSRWRAAPAAGAEELAAHVTEALALAAGGGIDAHITSWLHTPSTDSAAAVAADIDIAVSSPRQLAAVVDAAREAGITATATVKADTGLNRSGVAVDEWIRWRLPWPRHTPRNRSCCGRS